MPRVDYYAIEEKLGQVLRDSPLLQDVPVVVEGEVDFALGQTPWIGVYLERRDPAPNQRLDAGQSTRYRARFSVWCWEMSLESTALAIKKRDEYISRIEQVLMGNRTLDDMVDMLWLEGGEMPSGRMESDNAVAFLSGGETIVLAEFETTTT